MFPSEQQHAASRDILSTGSVRRSTAEVGKCEEQCRKHCRAVDVFGTRVRTGTRCRSTGVRCKRAKTESGANPGLPFQRRKDSYEHIRSPVFTPLWIENSISFLPGSFSVEKWSRSEIRKYIIARGLLCDEPSGVCRAACPRTSADAKTDRRNTSNRKSLHWPGLPCGIG